MRYRYDLGLRFEGPERLCEWCAELAAQCSCTRGLTNQYVASVCGCLLSSSRMEAPKAVRAPVRTALDWQGMGWCGWCKKRTLHHGMRCENAGSHER